MLFQVKPQMKLNMKSIIEQSIFNKSTPKNISPTKRKEFAKQKLDDIVSAQQKTFTNFENKFKNIDIGITSAKEPSTSQNSRPPLIVAYGSSDSD